MTKTFKKYLRSIYQKFSILRKIKRFVWRIKNSLSFRNHLPTSSSQNQFAINELTKRRFDYMERYFDQKNGTKQEVSFIDIDISVVTYNSSRWIKQFLDSLLSQNYSLAHINLCFVDHGSTDNTVELLNEAKAKYQESFQSFQLIMQNNVGFGAGHDRAIRNSGSKYCLVANIDLIFEKDSIVNIVRVASNDIKEEYASWEFRQIPYEHPKYYDPITLETNWSSHACVLIRRSAYEKVGGYEPKIFMYAEDVELSYRFRAFGYHLKYCPNAVVYHFTYEEANQIKPLQFQGSILGNAYLRLRYGNTIDKLAIIPLYLALLLRRERFEGSRKMIFKNILKIIQNMKYFSKSILKKESFYAPFREFDYEQIRDGAFYEIQLPRKHPQVSVILRTYQGRETLLKQALISISNQTYKNIEVIVVEDGGNELRPVAEAFHDILNVHYFSLPKIGRSATGNHGLENASGEYCVFLDDDDLFFADHIEILVAALSNNESAVASYSLAYEIPTEYTDDRKTHYYEGIMRTLDVFYQEYDYDVLQDHNFFPIQTVLFKRKLYLERGGFDRSLTYLEDWNLWLRYAYSREFIYVPKTTSLYRIPGNSKVADERHALLHQAYYDAKEKAMNAIYKMNFHD